MVRFENSRFMLSDHWRSVWRIINGQSTLPTAQIEQSNWLNLMIAGRFSMQWLTFYVIEYLGVVNYQRNETMVWHSFWKKKVYFTDLEVHLKIYDIDLHVPKKTSVRTSAAFNATVDCYYPWWLKSNEWMQTPTMFNRTADTLALDNEMQCAKHTE